MFDDDILAKLDKLEPNRHEQSSAHEALNTFHKQNHAPISVGAISSTRRTLMSKKINIFLTLAAFASVIAFSTLPSTRAFASQLLGMFRVQKFAPISVSPAQLALIDEAMSGELYPGEITYNEPEDSRGYQTFTSIEDAYQKFGQDEFYSYSPIQYINGKAPDMIVYEELGDAVLNINLEGARKIIQAAGVDPLLLPESLNGADITFDAKAIVNFQWSDSDVYVSTMEDPNITYPADVDPTVIGEALLRFLGLDETAAYRLAQNIDWTNTLLMPIPSEFATFSEVPIQGTSGLALTPYDGGGSTIMWQVFGTVYMISSDTYNTDQLLELIDHGYDQSYMLEIED